MTLLDAHRKATEGLEAPASLRYLLREGFPSKSIVTSALRARSVVVLDMVAEIDRTTPVVFCHAPNIYPESVDYSSRIVDLLGLTDVRVHKGAGSDIPPEDEDHCEEVRSKVWGGGTDRKTLHLANDLSGFECWISAVYHRPYEAEPKPRLAMEGRLLRVDPLSGWTKEEVRAYMAKRNLPYHPRVTLTQPEPSSDEPVPHPTYHF